MKHNNARGIIHHPRNSHFQTILRARPAQSTSRPFGIADTSTQAVFLLRMPNGGGFLGIDASFN